MVQSEPARAFAPIQRIGGRQGWYFATWLWYRRGFLDLLVGGVGMRRGRRHPVELRAGDPLDCWRVEAWEEDRLLRLSAEMKVPGRAWLQFEVEPDEGGGRITQTAVFDPLGLSGLLYWYGLYPIHWLIFRWMLRAVAARSGVWLMPLETRWFAALYNSLTRIHSAFCNGSMACFATGSEQGLQRMQSMVCRRPSRGLEMHIRIARSTPVSDLTSARLRRAVPTWRSAFPSPRAVMPV